MQFASSFVNRVSPANVGGMAANVRFLQRCGLAPGPAVAAVGLNSVTGGIVHVGLIVAFFTWSGDDLASAIALPGAGTIAIGGGVAAVALAGLLASRWARRTLLPAVVGGARASAAALAEVARNPLRLAMLFGGSMGVTLAYIGALAASVEAFGGGVGFAEVGAVYLAASAVAAASPTPGNLGAIEAALVAGLSGVGMPSGVALSTVLSYRLATYWLPIAPGWLAWWWLQRTDRV